MIDFYSPTYKPSGFSVVKCLSCNTNFCIQPLPLTLESTFPITGTTIAPSEMFTPTARTPTTMLVKTITSQCQLVGN